MPEGTTASGVDGDAEAIRDATTSHPLEGPEHNYPADSFRLRIEDVMDWVDRNPAASAALYYERDDSTKGNTNPKSHSNNHHHPVPKLSLSNSQRFSGNLTKPKPPLIGLPKLQHSGYLGPAAARRATSVRIFPKTKKKKKKVPRQGKSAVPEWEPGSPKVSCFGKVRSVSGKNRCRSRTSPKPHSPKFGFWTAWLSLSCCRNSGATEYVEGATTAARKSQEHDRIYTNRKTTKKSKVVVVVEDEMEEEEEEDSSPSLASPTSTDAPRLGGMKRFVSGRRSASWVEEELGMESGVARSGPLGKVEKDGGMRGRRSLGLLDDVDVDFVRNWEEDDGGPASV